MLVPHTYATSSQVLIKRPDTALQSTTYPEIDALLEWNRDTAMETYIALARQPAIAERVIHQLGLKTTVGQLLTKNVTISPLTKSDVINIAVDWPNAQGSAAIANAFGQAFIERQRVLAASQASEAAGSLSVARDKAQADLANADRALTLFGSRHGLTGAIAQTTSLLSAIADVQTKEREVQDDRVQAQGQLSSIAGQLSRLPPTVDASKQISSSPVADQIEQQLAQQQLELAQLRREFTKDYPEVVATENRIASLQSELAHLSATEVTSRNVQPDPLNGTLTSQAAALQSRIAGDVAQLQQLKSQESLLLNHPEDISQLSNLQRQAKAAESVYDALQSNYFNAVVAKSMAVSDLSIIQLADPSLATARPQRLLSLFVVSVVAFLATVAIVFVLDRYTAVALPPLRIAPGLRLPTRLADVVLAPRTSREKRPRSSSTSSAGR
jgi:uncharacterized protein involved in exopolysaccharide biosynthesis